MKKSHDLLSDSMGGTFRRDKYTAELKKRAVDLSELVSVTEVSGRLGIPVKTIYQWRTQARKNGRVLLHKGGARPKNYAPAPPPRPEPNEICDSEIRRAFKEARAKVKKRLLALPDACQIVLTSDGEDARRLHSEIQTMKSALADISGDQYYQILPELYFYSASLSEVSRRLNIDQSTVWEQEQRLLSLLTILLYGSGGGERKAWRATSGW